MVPNHNNGGMKAIKQYPPPPFCIKERFRIYNGLYNDAVATADGECEQFIDLEQKKKKHLQTLKMALFEMKAMGGGGGRIKFVMHVKL